jgi:RNA polymerase sigma-70 factor, ECF subfamily
MNTRQLIELAQAGDVRAFATLASSHHRALERFSRRLMGDASRGDDLVQETLLRAQQSIARLGAPYRFGPWLMGIAANLARKAWRAEARRPLSLESLAADYPHIIWDESDTAAPSPEQISEAAEESRLLAEAISALPRSLSRVVVLHYLDGLNYAEVAAALAVPVSTVKGRLFQSRARLRRELSANGLRPFRPSAVPRPLHRSPVAQKGAAASMAPLDPSTRNLRVEVRLEPLVDEALRYITLPWPRHDPEGALSDLGSNRNRFIPIVILEQMVLDGVTRRQDVADFLAATFDTQQFDVL